MLSISKPTHLTIVFAMLIVSGSTAVAEEVLSSVSTLFELRKTTAIPDFQKHVIPLLGRLGCNSAKCHGSFQGRGDLRLSLFGFDFQADHTALLAQASSADGQRLNLIDPENSLVVLKPTQQTDHGGGKRFESGSWEHHLLLRWIESGAVGVELESVPTAAKRIADSFTKEEIAFFTEKIQPLFEDHCYECHSNNDPKANLRLTWRDKLVEGGDSGAAVVPGNPDRSLLIQAVRYVRNDLQMPPSGKLERQEIIDLEAWVAMGAPWPDRYGSAAGDTGQVLAQLHCEPTELLFEKTGQSLQLKVVAEWENGTREDVTCLSRFQTNDDAVVNVNQEGLVISIGEGDTHIVAFYDNGVAAIPVLRPYQLQTPEASRSEARKRRSRHVFEVKNDNRIDQLVNAKLQKLGLVPSHLCTDAEFLRRVSIDMTGTLPTPEEVTAFLVDDSAAKRIRKIDELLERSTHAAWWANKLCDFTGCNPASIRSLLEVATEEGYLKASEWYDWIYESVRRNEPYDQLVEGIMLAGLARQGTGMPHFWTRQSLREPKDTAMSVAHAFLGIQLQCAECHKHPFDQWTQADFQDFARFFEAVTTTRRSLVAERQKIKLLRSQVVALKPGDDPREPIMEWMRDAQNPWFARAFVNRVWAGYFNIGIVNPPDQFTPANPPSNPQLLDWLTEGFCESGFDMKSLHRKITSSATYQRSWKPNATNRNDQRNFSRAIPRRIPAEVVYDAMKQATASSNQQSEVRQNLQRRASGHLSMRMAGTHAMKVFGKPARSINCDCERVNEPTLLQAIFAQNDPIVRMRLADSGWIIEIEDAELAGEMLDQNELINEVWLRTVSRNPSEEERSRAAEHFLSGDSLAESVADLMWALLNTKEFLLNH